MREEKTNLVTIAECYVWADGCSSLMTSWLQHTDQIGACAGLIIWDSK